MEDRLNGRPSYSVLFGRLVVGPGRSGSFPKARRPVVRRLPAEASPAGAGFVSGLVLSAGLS